MPIELFVPGLQAPALTYPSRRVLLVDDDDSLRELFRYALRQHYDVVVAGSAAEALGVLREQTVHVVISDINMPGQDGYQLLESIRRDAATALVPVILMTARPAFTGLRKGMGMGADDYLPKPFTIPELTAAVSQQLAKRDSLRNQSERELQQLRECVSLALPHELLTPLNGILGVADLLAAGHSGPQELAEFATMLRVSGERLQRLVQNILLNTQLTLLAREPASAARLRGSAEGPLGPWLRDVLVQVAQAADRVADVDLAPALMDPSLVVAMSNEHLGKVLTELLANACKFSARGQRLEVGAEDAGEHLQFSVCDHGRGMTSEEINCLGAFRQFGRREHAQEGAGLGATIARGLVELHGGSIGWDSAPGRGCRVVVKLPPRATVASG